jgi:uncharacterized protein involved in exopolysaccharide biosynthesis
MKHSSSEIGELSVGPDLPATAGEVTWLDVLTWVGQGKRRIAAISVGAALLATGVALLLPPVFTARTLLLPPGSQQASGASAALAALGSLGGVAGLPAAKTPEDLYVAILRSDSVVRPLAEKFKLLERYDVKTFEEVRLKVPKYVRVAAEKKSGVISLEVDDKEPEFAARLANAHVEELTKVLSRLAVSEAQQRRVFFARQLEESNAGLLKAEQNLKQVQQTSGLIVLDKQAEALINGAAQLRALIAEREVQLKVLRTSATDLNPEAVRLLSELQGLRTELRRLESDSKGGPARSPLDLPVQGIPEAASDYVRALRDVKYQEALFQSMLRQLEGARLDEAKEGSVAQQIDVAVPPDRKSKPSRALIVLSTFLLAVLASSVWVIGQRYVGLAYARDPAGADPWRSLRQAWRLR